jgi:hypothetical protein
VPYIFPNNVDNVPLKDPVPWRTNPDMCRVGYGQPLRSWHPPFDVLRNLKKFGYSLQPRTTKANRNTHVSRQVLVNWCLGRFLRRA